MTTNMIPNRRKKKKASEEEGNGRYCNTNSSANEFRIFYILILAFLVIISTINIMHHREFSMPTSPRHMSNQAFKNEPRISTVSSNTVMENKSINNNNKLRNNVDRNNDIGKKSDDNNNDKSNNDATVRRPEANELSHSKQVKIYTKRDSPKDDIENNFIQSKVNEGSNNERRHDNNLEDPEDIDTGGQNLNDVIDNRKVEGEKESSDKEEEEENQEAGTDAEGLYLDIKCPPSDIEQLIVKSKPMTTSTRDDGTADNTTSHTLGGLTCTKYGGPSDEATAEMVYWSDIPSDSSYNSPFKKKAVQYMTFEPDGGGWNNIRMAMETVVVLAHATGRTLVLPPDQRMYLLAKDRNKQKVNFSFEDFFHLESVRIEHPGIDIITTEEFLLREAMTGNVKSRTTGLPSFPPQNRTNWDGKDVKPLKEWLREVIPTPTWRPDHCFTAFPASPGAKHIETLNKIHNEIISDKDRKVPEFMKKPTPVDAKTFDRMIEFHANRKELCMYDDEMQNAPVLHFMCNHQFRVRLLTHFYAFVFFEDWKQQLWTHRFVRDHLRYVDELQCAAARIVEALRAKAKENGNSDGEFDTFHIRRGDFQYKQTRTDASVLYSNSMDLVPENATLYIATDERKKDYFTIFKEHYSVYFLDDFIKEFLPGMNTNYYGMLDQLIASKGRTFVGTFFSTFTGYINRMRGYHADKRKLQGHEIGSIQSFYFLPSDKKNIMQKYAPLKMSFWSREFPSAWRDIDKSIGCLR